MLLVTLVTLITFSYALSLTLSGSCDGTTWKVNYNGDNCDLNNGEYSLKSTYSANIKAVPGAGTNTAFYLFSYGHNNDINNPWVEIDIEIMGSQISPGQSRIFTNLHQWDCTHSKDQCYNQHYEFITVAWDASSGYHDYKIVIDDTHIRWYFDGTEYRSLQYTWYADVVQAVNTDDLQLEISLWGTTDYNWPEMGSMNDNWERFPLKAYFNNVQININGDYGAIHSVGGKCLDIHVDDLYNNGGNVQVWDCYDVIQQRWQYIASTGEIKSEGGKCLDVEKTDYDNNVNHALVQIWDCSGWNNQKWYIEDGQIKSGNGKCLDIQLTDYHNNKNGGEVQLYDCGGSGCCDNQKWYL